MLSPIRYNRIVPVRQDIILPASFTPLSLNGLRGWYRTTTGLYTDAGSTPVTNGTNAQQWNDFSGFNHHLIQLTSGDRPLYNTTSFNGRPGLTFDGVSEFMSLTGFQTTGSADTAQMSVFSAFATGATKEVNDRVLPSYVGPGQSDDWNNTASAVFGQWDSSALTEFWGFHNSSQRAATTASASTNYRFGSVYDGTNHTLYKNNVASTSAAAVPAIANNGRLVIGSGWASGNAAAFGNIIVGEIVIICNYTLSSTERSNLDAYFVTQWGL